jgi:hypothetical protein
LIVETYIAAALTVVASLLAGRTVMAACGREGGSAIEPAVGFATVMAILGILARFPGNREGLILGFAAICIASVLLLAMRRKRWAGVLKLPRDPWFWMVPIVCVVLTAIPFVVTGRWGLLGVGYNNDLGLHLAWAEWLRSGFGTEPSPGYPLGPHGLATALSYVPGMSLDPAFLGVLVAIPVLTAMTAWGAFPDLGHKRRALASVLVAFAYLMTAFYAQAAFKEIATAMFVLAFAMALPGCLPLPDGHRERLKKTGPLLVLLAGILFTYSFPGLAFPAAIAGAWLVFDPAFRARFSRDAVLRQIRRPLVLGGAVVTIAVLVVFAFVGPLGFGDAFAEVARSNAFGPVSAVEAFGVWLTSDYRLDGDMSTPLPLLMGLIGVGSMVYALLWWRRRERSVYPIAFLALAAFYLVSVPWVGDYSLAKALVIAAPVVMVTILSAVLSDLPARGQSGAWVRAGRIALPTVFVALAAVSSLLVLRDASVAPTGRVYELATFRDEVAGKRVLYGDQDRFAPGYFPESRVSLPLEDFPEDDVAEDRKKPFEAPTGQSAIDFDSFTADTFNQHDYFVTTSASWTSKPPAFFRLVDETPNFRLWKRTGKAFDRPIFKENELPAQLIDCNREAGLYFSQLDGEAVLMPDVELGLSEQWMPSSSLLPGESATMRLDPGPGRWLVSIQYFTPGGMNMTAPGYEKDFPAAINGQRVSNQATGSYGQFWPAGEIVVPDDEPVDFVVRTREPSVIQRLTGYSRQTKLGRLVLMRDAPRTRAPLSEICGRWVDFFRRNNPDDPDAKAPATGGPETGSQDRGGPGGPNAQAGAGAGAAPHDSGAG